MGEGLAPRIALSLIVLVAALGVWAWARRSRGPEAGRRWAAGLQIALGLFFALLFVETLVRERVYTRWIIDRYHELAYHLPQTHLENRWFGVLTEQNPNDVWITQELIWELKPDYIVETGTRFGGSSLLMATLLHHVNPEGRIISVDIVDTVDESTKQRPLVQEYVEFVHGSSTDPQIVADIARRTAGKQVLVILDSDHSRDHVLDELRAYAPIVRPGGYMIVQDTNVNGHPVYDDFGPGPMEALDAFLAETDEFVPDRDRERLLFTMHPKGYLRRRK